MRSFTDTLWVSLALSFLALAAVANATRPAFSAFGRNLSRSPWGKYSTTARLMELRGGGMFGGKNKSAARIYKESLEDQVLMLNEQLSHARTEVAKLRENAKKRHQAGSSLHRVKPHIPTKEESKASRDAAKQEERLEKLRQKDQKDQIARLEKEIKQLEQMKVEIEKMLETSAKKIELLEEQLATQDNLTAKLEASYKDKITKLEEQLEKVQTAHLQKLSVISQEKIDAAVKEALRTQEAEFRSKMEETTQRLSKAHAKEMEEEKLRSSKAVEAERKKMRKLVRALALREKKLKIQSPNVEDTKTKTTIKTKPTTRQQPLSPPTSRGTI